MMKDNNDTATHHQGLQSGEGDAKIQLKATVDLEGRYPLLSAAT